MNLRPVDIENCDMGACAKSWFYTEWGNRVGVTSQRETFYSFLITVVVIVQVGPHVQYQASVLHDQTLIEM